MARKKIVFVIVEGPSDADALDAIINRIFDSDMVHVHIVHGDLTTETGVATSSVINRVVSDVKEYAASNHFRKEDFKEIIHIVDTDGAFIPDTSVVEDVNATKAVYSLTKIHTANPSGIISRNHRKAANLSKLVSCKKVWSIPYRVFYMSCNLDHALYNKLNCNDAEKASNAFQFAKRYRQDIPGFLRFIGESDFSVMDGYAEAWKYIQEETRSLERHSNLGLAFQLLETKEEPDTR